MTIELGTQITYTGPKLAANQIDPYEALPTGATGTVFEAPGATDLDADTFAVRFPDDNVSAGEFWFFLLSDEGTLWERA